MVVLLWRLRLEVRVNPLVRLNFVKRRNKKVTTRRKTKR